VFERLHDRTKEEFVRVFGWVVQRTNCGAWQIVRLRP
jgi:hypothetical protein